MDRVLKEVITPVHVPACSNVGNPSILIVRMNVDNNTNKFDAPKLSDKVLQ